MQHWISFIYIILLIIVDYCCFIEESKWQQATLKPKRLHLLQSTAKEYKPIVYLANNRSCKYKHIIIRHPLTAEIALKVGETKKAHATLLAV